MRAMCFNLIVEYVPGKELVIGDALSRKPLETCEPRINNVELSDDITAHVEAVQQNWTESEDCLTKNRFLKTDFQFEMSASTITLCLLCVGHFSVHDYIITYSV